MKRLFGISFVLVYLFVGYSVVQSQGPYTKCERLSFRASRQSYEVSKIKKKRLRGIAAQLVIDYYREGARAPDFTSLSDASDAEKGSEDAAILKHQDTEQRAEREELRAELREAIVKLPKSYRKPLRLRMKGKSYKEISEKLGISEADVNNRLARGRAKLRVLMLELKNT